MKNPEQLTNSKATSLGIPIVVCTVQRGTAQTCTTTRVQMVWVLLLLLNFYNDGIH